MGRIRIWSLRFAKGLLVTLEGVVSGLRGCFKLGCLTVWLCSGQRPSGSLLQVVGR